MPRQFRRVRAESGDEWSCGFKDSSDDIFKCESTASRGGGEAGIGRQAGVRVQFQNPRLTGVVHSKIDAGVSGKSHRSPTVVSEIFELLQKRLVGCWVFKRADRRVVLEGLFVPFGGVADD